MRRALAAACATLLASAAGAGFAAAASPETEATVTVDTSNPGPGLAADLVGLSFEATELGTGGFDAGAGNLTALFRGLGAGNVRIGGNSLDRDVFWQPGARQVPHWATVAIGPSDMARLGGFLGATGWRAELGMSLGHLDRAAIAGQYAVAVRELGSRLAAIECGNEPNNYVRNLGRPASYDYPQFRAEWEACAGAVRAGKLAGPDTNGAWIPEFLADEASRIGLVTKHQYIVPRTAHVSDLLSPVTDAAEVTDVADTVAAAARHGLPLRLDETNSSGLGGIPGVSDAYASALWAMDYTLLMARNGVAGLNFHGGLGLCGPALRHYSPICATSAAERSAKVYSARPEYYGLWLASRMAPGRFLPATVTTGRNLTAYAVEGSDGAMRIALIEKDPVGGSIRVAVRAGGLSGTASVLRLTGGSLTATSGVAIQGSSVDRHGRLNPGQPDLVTLSEGVLTAGLPLGSAALITVPSRTAPAAHEPAPVWPPLLLALPAAVLAGGAGITVWRRRLLRRGSSL